MEIIARLKQNVTESQFQLATFAREDFDLGAFDINAMKDTDLVGKVHKDGSLYIEVLKLDEDVIGFGYDKKDTYIWDYDIDSNKNIKIEDEIRQVRFYFNVTSKNELEGAYKSICNHIDEFKFIHAETDDSGCCIITMSDKLK